MSRHKGTSTDTILPILLSLSNSTNSGSNNTKADNIHQSRLTRIIETLLSKLDETGIRQYLDNHLKQLFLSTATSTEAKQSNRKADEEDDDDKVVCSYISIPVFLSSY